MKFLFSAQNIYTLGMPKAIFQESMKLAYSFESKNFDCVTK
jgi:hypothetical protein